MAGPRKPRGRRGQGAENGRARLPPHTPTPTPMATALPPTHTGPRRPRQGHCLGPPDPWGATEAVKHGGQHTTPRGEGPCQCRPQARARVQGWGGGGNPWKRQAPPAGPPCLRLAWGGQCPRTPAELSPGGWCLAPRPQASAQGRRPGFGIRPWHRPWQGSPGSGQRVTGLSPKHATAGEARTGRLCPQHRRPPWTRRWQSPSRVVSWSEGLGPDRPSRA